MGPVKEIGEDISKITNQTLKKEKSINKPPWIYKAVANLID